MKIKKGDKVAVIAGKDKGKQGKVVSVDKKNNKVLVEGVNAVKKHVKPSAVNNASGIITINAPIDASNVMLVVDGKPTRVGYKVVDGVKQRVAKSTGEVID
ncbi:MAG: 50S ribosomal protein L24 [Firmicutes bacterium]|nr:50S ribosomal protein L24 [Bacillota bacterium]